MEAGELDRCWPDGDAESWVDWVELPPLVFELTEDTVSSDWRWLMMVQRKESESTTAVAKSRGGKIKHNEMENVKDVSEHRACV